MRTKVVWMFILTQMIVGGAEVVFLQRTEGQAVVLSCSPLQTPSPPTDLHLYHSNAQGQTTVLSITESHKHTLRQEYQGRLQLTGGLLSPRINITLSPLRCTDTGLYTWGVTSRAANGSHLTSLGSPQVLLAVQVAGPACSCLPAYRPLLLTIATAVGLLLLILIFLLRTLRVKVVKNQRPQAPVPIYEEMESKQRGPARSKNRSEHPLHLEEAREFPVYGNLNIRQAQDNHYACPRQIRPALCQTTD